jgi:hypothetical protein
MRAVSVFLVLAAVACAQRVSREETPAEGIFRYTTVGRASALDTIRLGEVWSSAAKYGASSGDTLVALPFGTFGGADAISVVRDTAGIVTALEFAYHARRDAKALLSEYAVTLGTPASVRTDSVGGVVRTSTIWRDVRTEFTFLTIVPPGADAVGAMAVLTDRHHEP